MASFSLTDPESVENPNICPPGGTMAGSPSQLPGAETSSGEAASYQVDQASGSGVEGILGTVPDGGTDDEGEPGPEEDTTPWCDAECRLISLQSLRRQYQEIYDGYQKYLDGHFRDKQQAEQKVIDLKKELADYKEAQDYYVQQGNLDADDTLQRTISNLENKIRYAEAGIGVISDKIGKTSATLAKYLRFIHDVNAKIAALQAGSNGFGGAMGYVAPSDAPVVVQSRSEAQAYALATSLKDLRRRFAAVAAAARFADDSAPGERFDLPGLFADPRFNAWIDGRFARSDDRRTGAEAEGDQYRLTVGASYRINNRVNLGVQGRFSHASSARDDGSSSYEAKAFGGSVFAQISLIGKVLVTPVLAYQVGNASLSQTNLAGTVAGDYDTDTWTFGAQLSRRWSYRAPGAKQGYWIEPQASVSHVTSDRSGYVRSDGIAVTGADVTLGTITAGPRAGVRVYDLGPGIDMLETSFGMKGIWTYETPSDQLITSGRLIETPDVFAALTGSVGLQFDGGISTRITGSYSGLGSDVSSMSIGGRLVIPFGR